MPGSVRPRPAWRTPSLAFTPAGTTSYAARSPGGSLTTSRCRRVDFIMRETPGQSI